MSLSLQNSLRCFAVFSLALLSCWQVHADGIPSEDDLPTTRFDDQLSTNWVAAVRAVLPAQYSETGRFDFQAATNGLHKESRRGNVAAQALWGYTLVLLSHSPESTDQGLKWLLISAEKGHTPAMLHLGLLYEIGKYVPQDNAAAFHWYQQAADAGNAEAQLQLGGCFHYGLGTTTDLSMAASYFRLSAGQTNYSAMKSLGYCLMNGLGVVTNVDEARYWFLRAANEGRNRRAMYNLGVLEMQKYPDTNAMKEGFRWMKQSADLGDALAAYELSNFYFRGWGGTDTNLASYHDWRFKAATWGATDAQFFMGQAFRLGDGVPTNLESSLFWYRKAAAKNHPAALYDLALLYREEPTNGVSVQTADKLMLRAAQMGHREAQFQCALGCFRAHTAPDFESGREWLSQAAESEWPKAEFLLFQLYYNGLSPVKDGPAYPKDKTEGIKWLRRAAAHGFFQAQSVLAVMLIQGKDLEPNVGEAEKLLRDAAEYGFAQAQNDLGFAILNRDLVSMDPTEPAMWCKLAISHTADTNILKRANINLANAMARLTAEQQQEVNDRVLRFQPQPLPEIDPKIRDWQKNPDYQREDGRYGH